MSYPTQLSKIPRAKGSELVTLGLCATKIPISDLAIGVRVGDIRDPNAVPIFYCKWRSSGEVLWDFITDGETCWHVYDVGHNFPKPGDWLRIKDHPPLRIPEGIEIEIGRYLADT